MNKFICIGRLCKDPEMRYSQNEKNTAIASFNVAVDRRFKREGQPDADFFNCTAFGKIAEFCEKYLKKGTKVVIESHIQNDSYTDKDGNNRVATKVVIDNIEFAESKNHSETTSDQTEVRPKDIQEELQDELPFT